MKHIVGLPKEHHVRPKFMVRFFFSFLFYKSKKQLLLKLTIFTGQGFSTQIIMKIYMY